MDIADELHNIDESIFRSLNHAGVNLELDLLMVGFTVVGMTYILMFIVPALYWSKRRWDAFDVAVLLAASDILSEVLKVIFARPRPFDTLADVNMIHWDGLTVASSFSFPSGHALRAFAVGAYLVYSSGWRIRIPSVVIPIMIGISRIYLGLHWPSDVVGGAVIGILLATLIYWLGKRPGHYSATREKVISAVHRRFNPAEGHKKSPTGSISP